MTSIQNSIMDISTLSVEQIDLLQTKIIERKFFEMDKALKEIKDEVVKVTSGVNIKIDELTNCFTDLRDDNDKKLEVAINQMRVDRDKWGYCSQSDFGLKFKVSMGARTVGKLFRIVGLAKNSKTGKTEPLRISITTGKATSDTVNGYEVFRWNYEKCLAHTEKWLAEHDLLGKFYSYNNEKELERFIKELFEEYT